MQSDRTLSILTAVYQNAESLPIFFDEIRSLEKELNRLSVALELILVDDGSEDSSLEELLRFKAARPATKVVRLSRNFGVGGAGRAGLKFVTGDALLILSADLQDPPEQVLPMVEQWLAGNKFVVCARVHRDDPLVTKIFAWVYYHILDLLVIRNYPRGGFDLMLVDKAMLSYLVNSAVHTNIKLYAFWLGYAPVVLPYVRRKRLHGRSGWTFAKKLTFFVNSVTGFSVSPLRLLSFFGIIVSIGSFLYGSYVMVAALLGLTKLPGFATLAILISFFSGLIILMLGMLGEYLWRVFDIVSNKPESVIEKTFL